MLSVNQNGANDQSPTTSFLELAEDLLRRLADLSGPAITAELGALRQIGEQLLEETKIASSVASTGLDLRKISSAKLRTALIAQLGPTAAANFATKLSRDLAVLRGTMKLATGGEIAVKR
jgi:hypothetical protein